MEKRYNNDLGFNYNWFLKELEAQPIEEPLYHSMVKEKRKINAEKLSPEATADETNIVLILAKIKAKVVRERIKVKHKMWVFLYFSFTSFICSFMGKVIEFMRQYDIHNEHVIKRTEFLRALDQLRCNLTCTEMGTIMNIFQSPLRYISTSKLNIYFT